MTRPKLSCLRCTISTTVPLFRPARASPRASAQGRQWLEDSGPADVAARAELFSQVRAALEAPLTEADFAFLVEGEFDSAIEEALTHVVTNMLQREIVDNKERLLAAGRPIMRRDAISDSEALVRDFSRIFTVEQARRELEERAALLTDLEPAVRRKVAELGASFIEPTLTFNSPRPSGFNKRRGRGSIRSISRFGRGR